jgi:hypothetical protein
VPVGRTRSTGPSAAKLVQFPLRPPSGRERGETLGLASEVHIFEKGFNRY